MIYFSMKNLMLMCKGFIIGIAKIIPGVSGAIIAISFGVYERIISIISNPLKIKLNDLKFLFFLLVGIVLGIGFLCKGVKWCLEICYLPTMLLFMGLIVGGSDEIISEIKNSKINFKNILVFVSCFSFLYYIVNIQRGGNIYLGNTLMYFLMGIIESLTTIIPGISGTAIFMALGWYETLLNLFEEITNFNIKFNVLLLFLCGFVISTILISKIITYLFKKYKTLAYTGVLAFMIASLIIMIEDIFSHTFSIIELVLGMFLFIFGICITKKINNLFSKL